MRLACLWAPGFQLQALARVHARAHALTDSLPLAVYPQAVDVGRATLLAVSRAAAQAGVRVGMGLVQARALCPALSLEPVGEPLLFAALEALAQAAASVSPSVEPGPPGLCFAELSGLGRLHSSEDELADCLRQAARRVRLAVHVGIAGTRAAARAAAQHDQRSPIPPGSEAAFLAPLSLAALAPSPELAAALRRFGLRTVGELAKLPREGVGARLGPAGVRLHRLACGEEPDGPLRPLHPEEALVESVELEWGVALVEPLLFALRQPLDRLLARLGERGLRCGGLSLRLGLEPQGFTTLPVEIGAPTAEPAILLSLIRSLLEQRPPEAPVVGLRLEARAARARHGQGRLFGRAEVSPERLGAALARVEAMVGTGRVGAAALRDDYLPGDDVTATLGRFDPPPAPEELPALAPPVRYAGLRLFRPPRRAEVIVERGRPAAVQAAAFLSRVIDCAGPYRVETCWWGERPVRLEQWDVSLGDGGSYRLAFERGETPGWILQGEYD
ncbi:MAG: Y-family DNA polymerase [Deltaproteobacteria bacterium]